MRWLFALSLGLLASRARATPFVVCLDPGHGGVHDGAISPRHVKEKDVALQVAKDLRALLVRQGDVKVVMTREGDRDVGLRERTAIANGAHADLFVSIHCNSMPTRTARRTAHGVETYFLSADASDAEADALAARENADSDEAPAGSSSDPIGLILQDLARDQAHQDSALLAEDVHRTLVRALRARNRGVKQAPFIVLLGAEMPAVLVEIGFISNPVEGARLARAAYQERVAHALEDAIDSYRKNVFAHRTAPGATAAASGTSTVITSPGSVK